MAAAGRNRERELKFAVDDGFVVPDLALLQVGAAHEVTLTADYWDTDDLRLLRWGHTVRHRRASDGSEDGWTVKLASVPSSGGAPGTSRDEINVAGAPDELPAEVRSLVAGFLRGAQLARQARLVSVRRSRILRDEQSGARAELADDRVTSTVAGEAGPAFRQVEIEVLHGSEGDAADRGDAAGRGDDSHVEKAAEALLAAVAERLVAAGAGPAEATPKLALVLGDRLGPPEVPAAELGRRSTVAELVSATIAAGARRLLLHDPYVRLGDDLEAVHQARVATRRLRADLATLGPLLEAAPVQRWRSELRWLGGLLGGVRDLDVLEARLGAQIASLEATTRATDGTADDGSSTAAAPRLLDDIVAERGVRRAVLADVMNGARYRNLLDDLVGAAATPPLLGDVEADERAAPVAAGLVRHTWRRLRRSVEGLDDDPADADLHEVRKRAKQARYAAELADDVLHGGTAALAERLADLQDVLGDLQDAVVARAWLADAARRLDGPASFLAGRLYERQEVARSGAHVDWRKAWHKARRPSLRRVL